MAFLRRCRRSPTTPAINSASSARRPSRWTGGRGRCNRLTNRGEEGILRNRVTSRFLIPEDGKTHGSMGRGRAVSRIPRAFCFVRRRIVQAYGRKGLSCPPRFCGLQCFWQRSEGLLDAPGGVQQAGGKGG